MFEKFYEEYAPKEQEVLVLIQKVWGASASCDGWCMTAGTLGMVFCADGRTEIGEGTLQWPVTDKERNSTKGWNRFQAGQICRIKVRKMLDECAKGRNNHFWCVTELLEKSTSCPQLEAVWAEYIKPVVIEDEMLGSLTLNRDFRLFEGTISWADSQVSLFLDIDPENKSTWTRARNAAKKLLADRETWDKSMREFAARKFTSLANDWQAGDEEHQNDTPITEESFARRISLSELTITAGGSFTAYFDDDDLFWGHAVEICGTLKKGVTRADIVG